MGVQRMFCQGKRAHTDEAGLYVDQAATRWHDRLAMILQSHNNSVPNVHVALDARGTIRPGLIFARLLQL